MKEFPCCHHFDDFVDDLLDESSRREFEEHLNTCCDCSAQLQDWQEIKTELADGFNGLVCNPKTVNLKARESATRMKSRFYWIGLAASVLILALAVTRMFTNPIANEITAIDSGPLVAESNNQDAIAGREPIAVATGDFSDSSFGVLAGGTKEFTVYQVFPNRFKSD